MGTGCNSFTLLCVLVFHHEQNPRCFQHRNLYMREWNFNELFLHSGCLLMKRHILLSQWPDQARSYRYVSLWWFCHCNNPFYVLQLSLCKNYILFMSHILCTINIKYFADTMSTENLSLCLKTVSSSTCWSENSKWYDPMLKSAARCVIHGLIRWIVLDYCNAYLKSMDFLWF